MYGKKFMNFDFVDCKILATQMKNEVVFASYVIIIVDCDRC